MFIVSEDILTWIGILSLNFTLRHFFVLLDLWPKREAEKRGSVTYSTDRENEVSKIFIISQVCV